MVMSNKITRVNVSVPYKGPGNIIRQKPVSFQVFSEDGHFKAVPLLNEDERRIANLPQELLFNYENGRPVSRRGSFDGNFRAIENIVQELKKQNVV
jgi:hypothetical protein